MRGKFLLYVKISVTSHFSYLCSPISYSLLKVLCRFHIYKVTHIWETERNKKIGLSELKSNVDIMLLCQLSFPYDTMKCTCISF